MEIRFEVLGALIGWNNATGLTTTNYGGVTNFRIYLGTLTITIDITNGRCRHLVIIMHSTQIAGD